MTTATLLCPLCGRGVRPARGARQRWQLVACEACGHVMAPHANGEALQQRHFGDAFAGADDGWTRAVDRANARRVLRVLGHAVTPGARVLEIGPGHGALLVALAAGGFRVEGLELSPAVALATSQRSRVPVRVGTIERYSRDTGVGYHAVVMRHVLEHMSDPVGAVEALHRLLMPGGVAYVAVPNIGAPESALPGWTGYQPYHLHYFTPARLHALFERSGFRVVTVRTREPFSGWVNAIVNSLRARRDDGEPAPAGRPGRIVVGVYNVVRFAVGTLLAPLRVVQAWSGRGEEIELFARKPERA